MCKRGVNEWVSAVVILVVCLPLTPASQTNVGSDVFWGC